MIKRWLGIDGMDLAIHGAITFCLCVIVGSLAPRPEEAFVFSVLAGSLGLLAVRRNRARARGELGKQPTGDFVADLEHRVADLEEAQQRVYELEERLDFAERLLARQREPEQLPEGR